MDLYERLRGTSPFVTRPQYVADYLDERHYLGRSRRGVAWVDEFGVVVIATPTSRRLPHDRWLELVRWCLDGVPNAGSQQWKRIAKWLKHACPERTTIVSYSDPSVGHSGSLYKACNWLWAPTWLRLRPPPTGNGRWKGNKKQATKDRWVYLLRADATREQLLQVNDESLRRRGMVGFVEPKRRW